MRAVCGFLMVSLVSACGGAQRTDLLSADSGGSEATDAESACANDADCPRGMLCESCGDGIFTCVPGCRTDAQCGANFRCTHAVQCTTCPCPSGWCELDPCRDLDGDGFAAAQSGTCALPIGDCDDSLAWVHPGGRERCANGVDDDCDGKRDALDDECRAECPGTNFCATSQHCTAGKYCERGCCDACPVITPPTCGANECLLPGGLDALGCATAPTCQPCASACPLDREPVCGKNFATYENRCLAALAGTTVAHDSECAWREGMRCFEEGECPYGQFCRTVGTEQHCSQWGTCNTDADCNFLQTVVRCDAGIAAWVCRNERCAASCP